MKNIDRRNFVKNCIVATSGIIAIPTIIPACVRGGNGKVAPSDKVRFALIGCGNQGGGDIMNFVKDERIQVVALCDVNKRSKGYWAGSVGGRDLVEARIKKFYSEKNNKPFKGLRLKEDFRDVIEMEDVDAVEIALPDHWHAIPSLMAAKSGKAIYCQKPLALTISEGRAISNAVKKYNTVFQTGSQQRSDKNFRIVGDLVRNGKLGKIHTVSCALPGGVPDYGKNKKMTNPVPIPKGFNYDLWLGPAPEAPYVPCRTGVNFRWTLDYSGGQLTDWGGHHPDIGMWIMGTDKTGPVKVKASNYKWADHPVWNTAIEYHVEAEFAEGFKMILSTNAGHGGILFKGEDNSWAQADRGSHKLSDNLKDIKLNDNDSHLYKSDDHFRNFIDCVISGKEPVAPAEGGHRSITIAHLGNMAMQLQQDLEWDPKTERVVNNELANTLLDRPKREPWDKIYKELVDEL
ncbi:Predicted dehydrogenase [Mariniphaga anaerophila]|uniref:Predicted dehydrogenase n=1 Tax=Mariniphaga anaerophila TaxID=1484053 RepID=A0A1M4U9E0_9BACT|nr:Gfo/Idh/MocA family oxidoreductase [Mariniphaga anaerophila]SHE53335.1 Predicted dehydrogenase [Mariniphaga anaerophila]